MSNKRLVMRASRGTVTHPGFTLLEVLVATVILGSTISALINLSRHSLTNVRRMDVANRAFLLGERKMNEIVASGGMLINSENGMQLAFGSVIRETWDEATRWEATVTEVTANEEAGWTSVVPVRINLIVYWKRNPDGRESQYFFETDQLLPRSNVGQ